MASGAEVDEAVSGVQRPPRPSRKELLKARREELAALPLWKKPFDYVLRSVQVIAALMFWACVLQLSVEGVLLGLAIGAVAEVLFQILKGKPYSWESP